MVAELKYVSWKVAGGCDSLAQQFLSHLYLE